MQKFNTLIMYAYVVAKDILFYLNTKNFLHSELKWHSEQRPQAGGDGMDVGGECKSGGGWGFASWSLPLCPQLGWSPMAV